ncbi:MAG: tail fiber domain-containing protein, partial [Bacteroidales bacterium]|nr:tail fiber domain-containing protein [Bacteroidales bacterium]
STKGLLNDYLQVSRDSTRVYISESESKGRLGGFAVSGRTSTKGLYNDYFNVSADSSASIINPSEPRILWYPRKEAFLTGRVIVEGPDSVGTNSMATGFESKAIGDYSQAMGYKAIARGNYATAIGDSAVALGLGSFSFGEDAKALNNESYAIGREAMASGYRSFAFGSAGVDTLGVETENTRAFGDYSIALGQGSLADAKGAVSLGTGVQAIGLYAFANGYNTIAQGSFSSAFGIGTYASGYHASAFGMSTHATGTGAVSFGFLSDATSDYTFALGKDALASKPFATAIGDHTEATADYATGIGQELIVNKRNEFVIGRYNSTVTAANNNWTPTDPLFIIGNGESSLNRSNAMVVYKNGNTQISGNLDVYGTLETSGINTSTINVDQEAVVSNYLLAIGGLHVGSTNPIDPGTNNLIVDGTSQFKGNSYFSATANFNNPVIFNNTTTFYDNHTNIYSFAKISNSTSPPINHVGSLGDLYVEYDMEVDRNSFFGGNISVGTSSTTYNLEIAENSLTINPFVVLNQQGNGDVGLKYINNSGRAFIMGIDRSDGNIFKINQANSFDTQRTFTINGLNRVGIGRASTGNLLEVNGTASKSTAGDWLANSDKRIKKDIQDIDNAYEILLQLHPVKFKYTDQWLKRNKHIENKEYYNFIAQEYQEVFPESVKGSGEYLEGDEKEILQLDSYNAQIVTIKAVQELILENKELRKRIEKLEEKLLNK